MVVGVLQRRARALFLNYKKTSFAKAIALPLCRPPPLEEGKGWGG